MAKYFPHPSLFDQIVKNVHGSTTVKYDNRILKHLDPELFKKTEEKVHKMITFDQTPFSVKSYNDETNPFLANLTSLMPPMQPIPQQYVHRMHRHVIGNFIPPRKPTDEEIERQREIFEMTRQAYFDELSNPIQNGPDAHRYLTPILKYNPVVGKAQVGHTNFDLEAAFYKLWDNLDPKTVTNPQLNIFSQRNYDRLQRLQRTYNYDRDAANHKNNPYQEAYDHLEDELYHKPQRNQREREEENRQRQYRKQEQEFLERQQQNEQQRNFQLQRQREEEELYHHHHQQQKQAVASGQKQKTNRKADDEVESDEEDVNHGNASNACVSSAKSNGRRVQPRADKQHPGTKKN